jgi:penicillin-insensitive murein endopeptidase
VSGLAGRARRPGLAAARWVALTAAVIGAGCASVPTPLAPGVKGAVGLASYGVLTEPAELPAKGPGFRRLRPWSHTNYGTPVLVKTLETAAAQVGGPEDPPLIVGDIAGPRGGHLPGHNSHRTGRDVDLLFFYTTPAGAPIEAPGFVKVGPDGLAFVDASKGGPAFVRLDVARTWKLARALLESPHASPQWIFVSAPIEALLIEHARALGEPPLLIWKAENVMHQPGDSAPHDDHFHLRLACTDGEAAAGCVSGAPSWPWIPAPTPLDVPLAWLTEEDG